MQVDELNLAQIGPKFEHHKMFPARTNTGLCSTYTIFNAFDWKSPFFLAGRGGFVVPGFFTLFCMCSPLIGNHHVLAYLFFDERVGCSFVVFSVCFN